MSAFNMELQGSNTLLVALSVVLGFIIAGLLLRHNFTSRSQLVLNKDGVLLIGKSGSGKTSLFTLLSTKKIIPTYTSLKSNSAKVQPLKIENPFSLIDVPGNEKICTLELERFLPQARAIIFMVDSFSAVKNIPQIADFLYKLLIHVEVTSRNLPILIIANKRDLATSVTENRLKNLLEAEIDVIRSSKSSSNLDQLGTESEVSAYLGFEDKTFEFDDIPNEISFLPLSLGPLPKPGAQNHSANWTQVEKILQWLTPTL